MTFFWLGVVFGVMIPLLGQRILRRVFFTQKTTFRFSDGTIRVYVEKNNEIVDNNCYNLSDIVGFNIFNASYEKTVVLTIRFKDKRKKKYSLLYQTWENSETISIFLSYIKEYNSQANSNNRLECTSGVIGSKMGLAFVVLLWIGWLTIIIVLVITSHTVKNAKAVIATIPIGILMLLQVTLLRKQNISICKDVNSRI